ncbi:MAG: hypothetical protein ACKVJG_19635 [Candidatus Latescibacterota bacterium]
MVDILVVVAAIELFLRRHIGADRPAQPGDGAKVLVAPFGLACWKVSMSAGDVAGKTQEDPQTIVATCRSGKRVDKWMVTGTVTS